MSARNYQIAAYYFPNWHRQPGSRARLFGEWGVLQNAPVRFPGHVQPKTPAWGYEDESSPKAMARKIDAAADHGVDVFLFDWYFNDRGPFLERPLNDGYLKAKNNPRVKFALMWANHDLRNGKGAIGRRPFDKLVDHVVGDYLAALRQARAFLDRQPPAHRILTVNAWNEWTEGSYLEPDTIHGLAYLRAIRAVFR